MNMMKNELFDIQLLSFNSRKTNLYGQSKAYGQLKNLICEDVQKAANEPLFSSEIKDLIIGKPFDFDELKIFNFVPTEDAKKRIATILLAVKTHNFLLISGPTSSAKTFSVLMAYEIFKMTNSNDSIKFIRKNLSEDTTRDDFIGSISFDEYKNQFIFKQGFFTEAFQKGYWILLDELSLAPPSVLQAIEAALDSGILTVQEIGETKEIHMNNNFFIVCTMNPNSEEYSRFNIPKEFQDRFLCIPFNNISNDEMIKILEQKCTNFENKDDTIQEIINTHLQYTGPNGPKCKNIFTLREFDKASILINNMFPTNKIIDILYRSRAGEEIRSYDNINPFSVYNIRTTTTQNKYGQLAIDCLKCGFNIILESCYETRSLHFSEAIAKEFNPETQPLIISMTKDIRVSDITEFSIPFSYENNGKIELKICIKNGVIFKAINEGRVVIINNLERANTKVIESINDIYDYNAVNDKIENQYRQVQIHPNFRIIFILHSNAKHKLSNAFLNRFVHIKIPEHLQEKIPIKEKVFRTSNNIIDDICKKENIALTTQIKYVYNLTKESVESNIPICFLGQSGYGKSIGIKLCLKNLYESFIKVHTIYCTSETNIDSLIGQYIFERKLKFKKGPLLKAIKNGGIVVLKNIDKLTFHAFSCIVAIFQCLENENREFIIPGIDLPNITVSPNINFVATIDGNNEDCIPHYIKKYFQIESTPQVTKDDYKAICKLYKNESIDHQKILDALALCFITFSERSDIFDTSFRMLNRILTSLNNLIYPNSPNELALNIFCLYQNVVYKNMTNLVLNICGKLEINEMKFKHQIESDCIVKDQSIHKGPLVCYTGIDSKDLENMSKAQLNASLYLFSCKAPILLVGPTSFKETLIKSFILINEKDASILNSNADITISDIIGSPMLKRNNSQTGKFKHGDVYDMLIDYMQFNPMTRDQIATIDVSANDSISKIEQIIDDLDEFKMKPYFEYLIKIIKYKNDFDTVFELGFLVRELLLGNKVIIKNIDQLDIAVIENIIPFLSNQVDLSQYIPDAVINCDCSIFFTCTEQGYSKLPSILLTHVQTVFIESLNKDDLKSLSIIDNSYIDAYDKIPNHDYSDISRVINIITVASHLSKCQSLQEKILQAQNIIDQNYEFINSNQSLFGPFDIQRVYSLNDLLEYNDDKTELKSIRTGATIEVTKFDESKLKDIIFVPCIAYLLDLCIISLATHIPLIVESLPSQAKSTLIRCLCNAIDEDAFFSTNMSKNKTTEDFIGQVIPDDNGFHYELGDLYKHINKNEFYLIDEINLGSPSLLSHILNVFKMRYKKECVHPHVTHKYVKLFHLFATMNPATLTSNRSYLPQGFISCSIIYKMPNYNSFDNSVIINSILNKFKSRLENFDQCVEFIVKCHKKCMEYSDDVTIRDIIKLSEAFMTYDKDELIKKQKVASLVQLIYSSKIIKWKEEFENSMKVFTNGTSTINDNRYLTTNEYLLLNQLDQALKMKRGIIITGPSGCGKTYCIQELAIKYRKIGKLHTVQLCHETDISEILGRLEPFYACNDDLINNLLKSIKSVIDDKSIPVKFHNQLNDYYLRIGFQNEFLAAIESLRNNIELMNLPVISESVNEFYANYKTTVQFKYRNSLLIDAMEKGDWVVLDNINLCPGDILESLNSLLEESHSIRITKGSQDTIYSMFPNEEMSNVTKINDEFRLFMTSDERSLDHFHTIPAPFLSRCIVIHINKPDDNDLPNIGRNYSSKYSSFLSQCILKDNENHTRKIIQMMKTCNFLDQTALNIEEVTGKTLKFVLGENFKIPDSFVIPTRDDVDNINEILAVIQTNLFNETLNNKSFLPFSFGYIKSSFQNLTKSCHKEELLPKLLATLKLSCYVISQKYKINTKSADIKDKLITLLLCGYIILINPKIIIPKFIWNLHFTPAIWDYLFVTTDEYGGLTNEMQFFQYIKSNISNNIECQKEFLNLTSKSIDFDNNSNEYLQIIKSLFERQNLINSIKKPLFEGDKAQITIESIPLSFPSIPNKILIKDDIKYSKIIELLNLLKIKPPFLKIIKYFNFNLANNELTNDFYHTFCNNNDHKIALIYDDLLNFDNIYKCSKTINGLSEFPENLYESIDQIAKNYNFDLYSLNLQIDEMRNFIINNSTELIQLKNYLISIIDKAESKLKLAYDWKKEKQILGKKRTEILNEIINLSSHIKNTFIKNEIDELRKNKEINEELLKEVHDWALFDNRIVNKYSNNFDIYNEIDQYAIPSDKCKIILFSVISASLIIPPHCQNFKLSKDIFEKMTDYISSETIREKLKKINSKESDQENLEYLPDLLSKFETISKNDLNSKKYISQVLLYMKNYLIDTCIVSESQPKEYIKLMVQNQRSVTVKAKMNHPLELQNKIIQEYDNIPSEEISIEFLKQHCQSIPKEDWGGRLEKLKFFDSQYIKPHQRIARYITNFDAKKLNIESKKIRNIKINNQNYQLVPIENVYLNYLYLKNIEKVQSSLANNFGIVEQFKDFGDYDNYSKILKNDIIIFLSQLKNDNFNKKEKEIIKKSYLQLSKTEKLYIINNNLHVLYNQDHRKQYIEFLNKSNNLITNEKFDEINRLIREISFCIKSNLSEIRENFIYLLLNVTIEDQLRLHGFTKLFKNSLINKVWELADEFLTQMSAKNQNEGKCIKITYNNKENTFYEIFESTKSIQKEINHVYSYQSLQFDRSKINSEKYNSFIECHKKYKKYRKFAETIDYIKENINNLQNYEFVKDSIQKIHTKSNPDINKYSNDLYNIIKTIHINYLILNNKFVFFDKIPFVEYIISLEPFHDINSILVIFKSGEKIKMSHEITYNIGECLKDSTLILNIINLTDANINIKEKEQTQIFQKDDLITLQTKISEEEHKIDLIYETNENHIEDIGSIYFKCKFSQPEIFLIFSIPVTINENRIKINGNIYNNFSITILSNTTVISHILKLDTLLESTINQNNVCIVNTNSLISLTFNQNGIFKAEMIIKYPSINTIIPIDIEINVDKSPRSFIFNGKTLNQLHYGEKMAESTFYIIKAPLLPPLNECTKIAQINNIPYLHLIYPDNKSLIQQFMSFANLSTSDKCFNIEPKTIFTPRLSEFKTTGSKKNMYFKLSNQQVYLIEKQYKDLIVEFIFKKNKLKSMKFVPSEGFQKNYSEDGIYISDKLPEFHQTQVNLLKQQITNTQNIKFITNSKSNQIIPWIFILRLFEKSIDEFLAKNTNRILDKLSIANQTYYVRCTENEIKSLASISEDILQKKIDSNIEKTNEYDINKLIQIQSIDCTILSEIITNLHNIKMGMIFYRQIYNVNIKMASNISSIYRILKTLVNNNIMVSTFQEIVSFGDKIFNNKHPISINDDSYKSETFQDINFEFPMENENTEYSHEPKYFKRTIKNTKKKIKLHKKRHINDLHIPKTLNKDFNFSLNGSFKDIYKILSSEELSLYENEIENSVDESISEVKHNKTEIKIQGSMRNINKNKYDESNEPLNTLERSKRKEKEYHDLSRFEDENTNLYFNNDINLIEGDLPNCESYIINILNTICQSFSYWIINYSIISKSRYEIFTKH